MQSSPDSPESEGRVTTAKSCRARDGRSDKDGGFDAEQWRPEAIAKGGGFDDYAAERAARGGAELEICGRLGVLVPSVNQATASSDWSWATVRAGWAAPGGVQWPEGWRGTVAGWDQSMDGGWGGTHHQRPPENTATRRCAQDRPNRKGRPKPPPHSPLAPAKQG
ncbi:hypothetical protein GGTG_10493 [Gaeumannomyces tritici R3-111a-1]|uniref:Uncharacterized protein n=1 Tax=Gaeumannomyces tritici (strain R3-111a-1) TaxID=644352 RepID=J3PAG7_GAET3|nr:hypothetical protein GGTG_10493 [Gaeumannomyces tritici R3-111a-1]EJT71233.1 hypothetical protein GGTG_10493 [Gaeumannomyces tritici R3-111a-1]